MLQSEFCERTKVNLTGDEYVKVETLYNEVKMGKDEFCKEWLKLRNNPLMKEAIDAFYKNMHMVIEIAELKNRIKQMTEEHETDIAKRTEEFETSISNIKTEHNKNIEKLCEKIICCNGDADRVLDTVVNEVGTKFVIATKIENGISLNSEEKECVVSFLKS